MNTKSESNLIVDTITKAGQNGRGKVIVSGSHGGVYAAYLACKAGARAVILNDAGVGKDNAGIAGLDFCQNLGVAAAVVDYRSARIGSAGDMLERGRISYANRLAREHGCKPGISCREAAGYLSMARQSDASVPPYAEAREEIANNGGRRKIICVDSASLITPADEDQIVITGSHGALLGGQAAAAIKARAFAAVFNDAGIGIDQAGIGRLAVLDEQGIAAATVAAASARIGDGRSSYYDGVISAFNNTARQHGPQAGMSTRMFIECLQKP